MTSIFAIIIILCSYLKFSKSGNQNNNWNEAHFSIDEMEDDFQIVFVADGAKNHLSDIAIDDVKIMFGTECKSLDNHDDESDDSAEYEPTTTGQLTTFSPLFIPQFYQIYFIINYIMNF